MSIDELRAGIRSGPGRLRSLGVATVLGLGVLAGTVYAGPPADAAMGGMVDSGVSADVETRVSDRVGNEPGPLESAVDGPDIAELTDRVNRVAVGWAELSEYYDATIAPIERVLHSYSRDTALVEQISLALVREAKRVDLEPRLLLAVLLVENPWLDPDIRSPVGAIGLMQVMPLHRGSWPACDSDLEDVDANICHGARIFAHYYDRSNQNLDRALLRYNGCVNGTNTPDCHQYPNHVFAHAGRASVTTWLRPNASDGT